MTASEWIIQSLMPVTLVVACLMGHVAPLAASAGDPTGLNCSPRVGELVLNEVNTRSEPDYVEVYFLADVTLESAQWYLWIDAQRQLSLPAGSYARGDFLLLYTRLNPAHQEVMLVSSAAASLTVDDPVVVDYLGYGNAGNFHPEWSVPAHCGTVYSHHSASNPVIDRPPDGSGDWADHADQATPGAPNDGSAASCSLGGFRVQAPDYALACPQHRAAVDITALCRDGSIKRDYVGSLSLSSDRASARFYLTPSGGHPVAAVSFDGSEGGRQSVYLSDDDEHLTGVTVRNGQYTAGDSIDFRAFGLLLNPVPASTACRDIPVRVTAYGQNPGVEGCEVIEGFSGDKSLKAWFSYRQPSDNPGGTPLVLYDRRGPNELPLSPPTQDNIELAFRQGSAGFSLNYADAGRVQFNLRHDQVPYDGSRFAPMLASSNAFTLVPAAFGMQATDLSGNIELHNTTHSGEPQWAAGADFRLQIRARCDYGTTLSNYRPSAAAIWIEMLLPANAQPGILRFAGRDFPARQMAPLEWHNVSELFVDGRIAEPPWDAIPARFSEVGVWRLHLRDSDYLGEHIPDQVLTVGRFTPAYFEVTGTRHGQMQANCGSFSYTGKASHYAVPPALIITARNEQGLTTQNYTGEFMKLTPGGGASVEFTPPERDASQTGRDATSLTELSARLHANLEALEDHADGTLTYPLSPFDAFTYQRNDNARIAPYSADIALPLVSISDGDGIRDLGAPVILHPRGMQLRFGRLVVDNAYGPQTDDLPVPVRAEYFDGQTFVANTDDYCTRLAPLDSVRLTQWEDYLAEGETAVVGLHGLLAGSGEILLSAPGVGSGADTNDGSVAVMLELSQPTPPWDWLRDDRDGDGEFDENPQASASFGMYRGDDRFLYWREAR